MNAASVPRPLRVLHVITRMIVGGAQENTLYSCCMMDRSRIASEILCGTQTGVEGDLFDEARREGVPVHLEPSLVRQIDPLRDLVATVRIASFLRRGGYDVVHVHTSKAGIVGRFACALACVPVVVFTAHGWNFTERQGGRLAPVYLAFERFCGKLSHALVFVAESDRRLAVEKHVGDPARHHLIRSGVRLETFRDAMRERDATRRELGLSPDAFVFGTVGRLGTQKAPLDLFTAFRKVAAEAPHAHLLYVGDGPQRGDLEHAIAAAGLGDRVRLVGLTREVPRMQSAFDAFVLASRWEGLPRVFPQAMAAGLPIVATRVDGAPDAVADGENGWLVEVGDMDAMAERMLRLVRDPALARRMGEAGARRSGEFSARKMVDDLAALYASLVEERGRSRASHLAGAAAGGGR